MITSQRLVPALLLLLTFLASCGRRNPQVQQPTSPVLSPTLPPAEISVTQAPNAEKSAQAYLQAMEREDYPAMYALLTAASREAISAEEFASVQKNIAAEAALSSVETSISSSVTRTHIAQVSYQILLHSALVGDLQRDATMDLSLENGQWRVNWDPGLILPELSGGNTLRMDFQIPARGDIFDSDGQPLVAQADAVALGIIPDQIDEDEADALFGELFRLTGIRPDALQELYEESPAGTGWYVPLKSVSAEEFARRQGILTGFSGLVYRPYSSRYHFEGGIAPHVVGYISSIQEEEVEELARLGYRRDQKIGRIGLERWGEQHLSGVRGGSLQIVGPDGQIIGELGSSPSQPSQSIYTTIHRNLQLQVQQAIAGFRGAIVVLERDTGRVLAMASSPGFDPNLFEANNFNSGFQIQDLFDQQTIPLLNRAAQGQYPLGSVFKIITMAAALESGLYTAETTYDCQYEFNELQGVTLYDWTLEKEFPPSGILTLPEGLMRSCNNYFYHISADLHNRGLTTAISDMARDFGLGTATGIEQIEEAEGRVPDPDPDSPLYATSLAVGQADLQVTPLQVASFVAAVGNGGSLYRPQVVEQIAPANGGATFTFRPEVRNELPVSEQNLDTIQQAMVRVVADRRGTAYREFLGFRIPLAGKTGTAEDPPRDPHAWFAGYTFAEREDLPDIAVAVVVENTGEGSEFAAPIFRRVLETYFFGRPLTLYPWESQIGVPRPEPEETETPAPEDEG